MDTVVHMGADLSGLGGIQLLVEEAEKVLGRRTGFAGHARDPRAISRSSAACRRGLTEGTSRDLGNLHKAPKINQIA